jgi:hypothetical protein
VPDRNAPIGFIQNALSAGELSPDLYGRTDLAKYHQGCMIMRNWFVNYRGGASTRAGTQYMGQPGSSGYARLWPFKFSTAIGQTYMLVFSNLKLRFIKNPGGNAYPNGSNAGYILSAGVPYEVTTPYLEADLPYLKFSQNGDQLTITRRGYTRRVLSRIADTNWTLTTLSTAPPFATAPTISGGSISALPAGSTDPQSTYYMYCVTAVDANGSESPPSAPFIQGPGIDIGATQGTVSLFFTPVSGAVYYKVYKALPSPGKKIPSQGQQFGFAGFTYGTLFLDSNIVADFAKSPPSNGDPFANGKLTGFSISASSNDWPVVGSTITVSGGGGSGAVVYPVIDKSGDTESGHITGLYIANPGSGYTSAPTLTAGGGGTTFTATAIISSQSGNDPDVVGLFQQRQIYASTNNFPATLFGSRPGAPNDFRSTNPTVDSDAYQFTIAQQQINTVLWMVTMPGGLVVGTDAGVVQLTGGSASAANPTAVTASSAVFVPQSYYGASDVHPIVIDYDVLYVQLEASIIRDLQYNFFVNIYTGTDVSVLSSHLFYPLTVIDWAYQDAPNKVIWAVRSDGILLSLTYLKAQEILGWAWHQTQGTVESVGVVQEGPTDAIYLSINRGGTRFIERMCDRVYFQVDDSWCLDAALSTQPTFPATTLTASGTTGSITLTAGAAAFGGGDIGKVIRATHSKATITGFTDTTHVTATVAAGYPFGTDPISSGGWRMDSVVSTVTGLSHLNGFTVFALVDGVPQGPLTVSGGSVTLTTPGSSVVVGLLYQCHLQPLFFDPGGEATVQGTRKKNVAVTLRVKDAAKLNWGTSLSKAREFVQGQSSTDPAEDLPYLSPGLQGGDIRMTINQEFNRVGSVYILQPNPLPATVLAVISEEVQGDTR